jgi:putative addiction module killer protein
METKQTPQFSKWLNGLKDRVAYRLVTLRIARIEAGLMGDVKSIGDKVRELRINTGPGYRVYFTEQDGSIIILLCGGDKGSQDRDISKAKEMAAQLE